VRINKRSLAVVLVLIASCSGLAAGEAPQCRDVTGELMRTPGGSPVYYGYTLRTVDGELILIESLESGESQLLETFRPLFGRGDGPVAGSFTICITGKNPTPTYSGKTIFRARITAYDPGASK
jgi:hypothetical protein